MKMKNKKPNKLAEVLQMFPEEYFVTYHGQLAAVLGSVNAGLVLSHLLYWHGKGAKVGYIYVTIEEMKAYTFLSRHQQDSAIKQLVDMGFLEVVRKGIPAKRHFKVNLVSLQSYILSLQKSGKLGERKLTRKYEELRQTITESKTENKTDIKDNNFLRKEIPIEEINQEGRRIYEAMKAKYLK